MNESDCSVHTLVADVALFAGDRVALVRYASGYDGQAGWFLPDDELKHLEHPDKAARRILSEQLGLSDVPVTLHHIESFRGNNRTWHLAFHYTAKLDDASSVVPSSNLTACEWFPMDALPDRAEVAHHGWALTVLRSITADKVGAR